MVADHRDTAAHVVGAMGQASHLQRLIDPERAAEEEDRHDDAREAFAATLRVTSRASHDEAGADGIRIDRRAAQVASVEIVPELSAQAAHKLAAHDFDNIQLEVGDAANSWGSIKYDVIVLTGSLPDHPKAFLQQLNIGGRLFAIVGDAPAMQAKVFTRLANDVFECVTLFETNVALLQNAPQPQRFVF